MQAPGLLLAGLLSFLPFALSLATGGELVLEGASWTVLALAPWLALAGLPAERHEPAPADAGSGLRWLLPLALALPAVGLGLGSETDHETRATLVAAGGLLLVALWARVAHTARGRGVYGFLWLVFVPGGAALGWALAWAPGGAPEAWPARLAWFLPLPWIGHVMEPDAPLWSGLAGNLALVLAVLGGLRLLREEDLR